MTEGHILAFCLGVIAMGIVWAVAEWIEITFIHDDNKEK